jgi:curved DNA-binding protein CbpA
MKAVVSKLTKEESTACIALKLSGIVDEAALKKRYHELALEHHPDRGGQEEAFKNINNAYELLSKITPVDCSQNIREFEEVSNWIFGSMRRETMDSLNRRFAKYAPEGFTLWREHVA